MGVCHSTKQLKNPNLMPDLTMSQQMFQIPQNVISLPKEVPQGNLTLSEVDLLATDEIPNNSQQKPLDELLQQKLIRHVNSQQLQSNNQKRYTFVYDRLYSQQRKVPLLFPLEQSTLMKKRKSTSKN